MPLAVIERLVAASWSPPVAPLPARRAWAAGPAPAAPPATPAMAVTGITCAMPRPCCFFSGCVTTSGAAPAARATLALALR